jgi:hypothetical protein
MPLPESFIAHLKQHGYHPRSNRHSNAVSSAIVADLLHRCATISSEAAAGRLVYDLNMHLRFGASTWNVDLVLGPPAEPVSMTAGGIVRSTPATVRIAIEIKGVMTEHRKAVKNRKRDFEAHHEHVHNYNRRAVAGGVMVVNAALRFSSQLRGSPIAHGQGDSARVARLVEHCVTEMRNVTQSGGVSDYGMDAKTAIVVDFDNIDLASARFVPASPAPQPGDPLHYDSFIQGLCERYEERFAR